MNLVSPVNLNYSNSLRNVDFSQSKTINQSQDFNSVSFKSNVMVRKVGNKAGKNSIKKFIIPALLSLPVIGGLLRLGDFIKKLRQQDCYDPYGRDYNYSNSNLKTIAQYCKYGMSGLTLQSYLEKNPKCDISIEHNDFDKTTPAYRKFKKFAKQNRDVVDGYLFTYPFSSLEFYTKKIKDHLNKNNLEIDSSFISTSKTNDNVKILKELASISKDPLIQQQAKEAEEMYKELIDYRAEVLNDYLDTGFYIHNAVPANELAQKIQEKVENALQLYNKV